MGVMTLRDVPDDLQDFLKQDAAAHHRSVNKQAIAVLSAYRAQREKADGGRQRTPEERRLRVQEILDRIQRERTNDARSVDEILGYGEDGLWK